MARLRPARALSGIGPIPRSMGSDMTDDAQSQSSLPPAQRKRLQQCFERGNQLMVQGNFQYAEELFTQCFVGDPGNVVYLQTFIGNLKKKYNNNKKGNNLAFIKLGGLRRSIGKAAGHKDWPGAIKAGAEALKVNPWDVATLVQLADVADEMELGDATLVFLKAAGEAAPNDIDVARRTAKALYERGRLDQALLMWGRVLQLKPDDEEAVHETSKITVEKTIQKGGYEDAEAGKKKLAESVAGSAGGKELTPEQRLQKQIARNPGEVSNYLELAEIHLRDEHFDQAVELLSKAVEVSKGDTTIRERLEDAQLRLLRSRFSQAEKDAAGGGEEAKQRLLQAKRELVLKEIEIYQSRCERFPQNLVFRYELGTRYQMCGKYKEAITEFQRAQGEPRKRGACLLRLGQCFQQINQHRLAMDHYKEAVKEIPDRDLDEKKRALYYAGRLAYGLKDFDTAESHLTTLARLDFSYRDVSELLDKINQLREDKGFDDQGEAAGGGS